MPEALGCYERPPYCWRAGLDGEAAFRAMLVRHAEIRVRGAAPPKLLTPERLARQRAAENCPHRDCVGCGCKGCRCRPEGRRPGQVVTIADCLACLGEATAPP